MSPVLSKSKLLAYRQCAKRLWLEVHHPELRADSAATEAAFNTGHAVGEMARRLYDPKSQGRLVDLKLEGVTQAIARTKDLLKTRAPVFEAGFAAQGARAFADILLPVGGARGGKWRMVEVKSSADVLDYQEDDAAIQHFTATRSGLKLDSIAVANVETSWTYPGNGDYTGLLTETDVTQNAIERAPEVRQWIAAAQAVARKRKAPAIHTGKHCNEPFPCGFEEHCVSQEEPVEHPVRWLPGSRQRALKKHLQLPGVWSMADVPDDLLNASQLRVKQVTLSNQVHFDKAGAAAELRAHKLPALFLDFEAIAHVVPVWKGTRPYMAIPFQFSLHRLARNGALDHREFLDLSGNDPSAAIAEALVRAAGTRGPIFVYSPYERTTILGLAGRLPKFRRALEALAGRFVDLLPVVKKHYYHPSQHGSWGLKAVLPAVLPPTVRGLSYSHLEEVSGGIAAQLAYQEAIAPETTAARKQQLRQHLTAYCKLDTLALVHVWRVLSGRTGLKIPQRG